VKFPLISKTKELKMSDTINKILYVTNVHTISAYRKRVEELGLKVHERSMFSGFHGTEFVIERPRGRGCAKKIQQIDEIFSK
jgi:hypothetical protein